MTLPQKTAPSLSFRETKIKTPYAMKLKEVMLLLGVTKLELKQYKENGSHMANVGDVKLFTTKATDIKAINGDSEINIIDGKYYIGEVKAALHTHTVNLAK